MEAQHTESAVRVSNWTLATRVVRLASSKDGSENCVRPARAEEPGRADPGFELQSRAA